METTTRFSRPSAAWAIASMPKLKERFEDPFFRSTWNVVNVQIIFVLLSMVVFGFAMLLLRHDAQRIIDQQLPVQQLSFQLSVLRDRIIYATFAALAAIGIIFGILSARYALSPTRNSLEHQRRFIGNLAHELRTPLSIIRTGTEVALMDKSLEAYARSTMETTLEELDRISGIINNLLSFESLMRPGHIKVEPLLLRDIASSVVHRHREMAKRYGINLGIDAEQSPAYMLGNKIALEQAVTNLVKNALNYTPQHDGRSVVVRIDDKGDEVALSVIDTGIGIAQKELLNVFQPFYRGDTSRTRDIGSGTSGLGLAIVNDIVRAHNGHLTIRSALNRGTTIELSFPKADPSVLSEEEKQLLADSEEYETKIS